MPIDFSEILVVGVSSRALFNLEEENQVFKDKGIEGFRKHQLEKEHVLLEEGTAYPLIQNLLKLNDLASRQIVEVVIMSRNSPETGTRILKSIKHLGLAVTRWAFTGGEPLSPLLDSFSVDLFLSKDESEVQKISDNSGCATALIYDPPSDYIPETGRVKFAFDADAVVFSDESEQIYKEQDIAAFHKHELENEDVPLNAGPFADLIKKLSKIQEYLPTSIELTPLRIAIVTARNAPSHMRVIKTLREWGVYVDEAYFLGGLSKDKILKALGSHIFFDDQETHLDGSSKVVPCGKVLYKSDSPLKKYQTTKSALKVEI
jgi:5'-nucleotidase